ncbi:MAG: hypothetical protein OEV78_02135 [Spirochaetia bacterium]|nr:hypothetical protein [Spirochaetia bacterium]
MFVYTKLSTSQNTSICHFVPIVKGYLFIFLILLDYYCGNPAIIRYLEPVNPIVKDSISKKNPYGLIYKIFDKNGLVISIKNTTNQELERIARTDTDSDASFRIPQITCLKFFIENNSEKEIIVNLFNTQLTDFENIPVLIFSNDDFTKNYTSVAYKNFQYKKVFSFYITSHNGIEPKNNFYYEKISPDTTVVIKPGHRGFQIIPFHRISERSNGFTLTLPLPKLQENINIPLKYIVFRSDK